MIVGIKGTKSNVIYKELHSFRC